MSPVTPTPLRTDESVFHLPAVRRLMELAIDEDLGGGDLTSALTIPAEQPGRGLILAREPQVVCGLAVAPTLFELLGWPVTCERSATEGEEVPADRTILRLSGKTRHLLGAERLILNFMQRLTGVATRTRRVKAMAGGITVLDTRKTTPGWRLLEKYAVRVGGGANHRGSLSDMILVKNNHIAAFAGSVRRTLTELFSRKPLYVPVEVEVRTMTELREALEFDLSGIMLDNMSDEGVAEALTLIRARVPKLPVEVSGGLTAERLKRLSALGVTLVSMGSLTTQATNCDISMRIEAM